jgi:hypothetical protein
VRERPEQRDRQQSVHDEQDRPKGIDRYQHELPPTLTASSRAARAPALAPSPSRPVRVLPRECRRSVPSLACARLLLLSFDSSEAAPQ